MDDFENDDMRVPCPHCLEQIRPGAIKCRYCKSDLRAPTRGVRLISEPETALPTVQPEPRSQIVEPAELEPTAAPQSNSGGLLWLIFMGPGAVILWFEYFFPGRGNVLASGRRYGNPVMQFIYSIAFYISVSTCIIVLILQAQHKM